MRQLRRVRVFDGEEAAVVKLMHGLDSFEREWVCAALHVQAVRGEEVMRRDVELR